VIKEKASKQISHGLGGGSAQQRKTEPVFGNTPIAWRSGRKKGTASLGVRTDRIGASQERTGHSKGKTQGLELRKKMGIEKQNLAIFRGNEEIKKSQSEGVSLLLINGTGSQVKIHPKKEGGKG